MQPSNLHSRSQNPSVQRMSCHPVSCAHDGKIIRLRKWMKEKAGFRNSLIPAHFADTGRGLLTKKPIREGEVIVAIPLSLLITTQTVFQSDIGHHIKRWVPRLTPQQCLTVYLIWEHHLGEQSDWFPYIDMLPEYFTTPAYFSERELQYLPKETRLKAVKEIEAYKRKFKEVEHFSENKWRDFYRILTYEKFRWAWYVINTRSVFYLSCPCEFLDREELDNMALAPFLDLLNHSPTANISAGFNPVSGCYEITTNNRYKPYDQVFISYGTHGNQKLFKEYGFCVPSNLHDDFEILYEDILKACKEISVEHLSRKLELLKSQELLQSLSCTSEGLSRKTAVVFKTLAMSWDQLSLSCTSEGLSRKTAVVFKTLAMSWDQLQRWHEVYTDDAAFDDLMPLVTKLANYILSTYLKENIGLSEFIRKHASEGDNSEHLEIARQLVNSEHDILMTSCSV